MPSQLDLYRSAAVMLRHHGQDAMLEAVYTCDSLRQKGDAQGAEVWRAIMWAIDELERQEPNQGERLH